MLQTKQRRLRKYLLDNHEPYCIICKTKVPVYALECAHIKPRSVSNNRERNDTGIVYGCVEIAINFMM